MPDSLQKSLPHALDAHPARPTSPAPGPQPCCVPRLGGEAKGKKGSASSVGSSKHRELKRTTKTAAGTVQAVSPARKSTGLVQRQGQDRGAALGPCTPMNPCRVPYVREVEMETFQKETEAPLPIHSTTICRVPASCVPSSGPCGKVTQELCGPHPHTHAHSRNRPEPCSLRPPWKPQETAASTQISLSGLANLQRARRITTSLCYSHGPGLGAAQGRGQTTNTAVPGIGPLGRPLRPSASVQLDSCPEVIRFLLHPASFSPH